MRKTDIMITTTTFTGPRFADFFDTPLPRGLRELAAGMSWDDVAATLGSSAGRLSLDDRTFASLAVAPGPLAALTAMLYEWGIAVEMLNFHQLRAGGQTATFIRGTDGTHTEWASGWSEYPTESALRALLAWANRLA